jgi:perosamine synthetase
MIPIAKPLIGEEEKEAVLKVLESGMLTQGDKVREFEEAFANLTGVKHAIATSNGTTALHAALLAHDIREGDEVITSPFTFIATGNSIRMVGAKPVFIDIDEKSFNINPELIENAITEKTRAIMPVHLYGKVAEMEKIMQLADKYNLAVIEDACQAHGATYNGKKAGSFATGCFSFYATKNMITGEGGMITTNDNQIAVKLRKLINHGSKKRYHHDSLGYNYRMTNISAAIGIVQLNKLQLFTEKRRANAKSLQEKLSNIRGIITPNIDNNHVFHQFTIRITPEFGKTREEISKFLTSRNIGNSIFYPIPLHKQKAFPEYNQHSYPVSEKIAEEVLSLPVHPSVSEENCEEIAQAILDSK